MSIWHSVGAFEDRPEIRGLPHESWRFGDGNSDEIRERLDQQYEAANYEGRGEHRAEGDVATTGYHQLIRLGFATHDNDLPEVDFSVLLAADAAEELCRRLTEAIEIVRAGRGWASRAAAADIS